MEDCLHDGDIARRLQFVAAGEGLNEDQLMEEFYIPET
jgi:hypothetical protein